VKTATHPEFPYTIQFDPATHSYRDDRNREYISATTFISHHWPPFDERAAAARIADRTGRLELEILAEWKAKREASAGYGTRIHAYAEARALGQQPEPPDAKMCGSAAELEKERAARTAIDAALTMLAGAGYDILEPELIVFDPLYRLAGTIDLPMRAPGGGICIADWKTCEAITDDDYNQHALPPIEHVRASKLAKYSLQLSLYGWMLRDASYVPPDTPIEIALIHLAPGNPDPIWMPLTFAEREIDAMVKAWWERVREFDACESLPA